LERVTLHQANARALPFAPQSFDALTCDLPWGDAVGSHAENAALYPAFLKEAARIARPGARLVLLTHEPRLFARLLAEQADWRATAEHRVYHGGHHPRLYRLERQPPRSA
jgi:23S rRNA G2445 N2-methylase RlmL